MNTITLQIPIKPHLKDYIGSFWKSDKAGNFEVSSQSAFGHYIYKLVSEQKINSKSNLHLGAVLNIRIPKVDRYGKAYDGRCKCLGVTDIDAERFNEALEQLLKRDLFQLLDNIKATAPDRIINDEIVKFMKKYNLFEHELTLEKFKKAYYRLRKSRQTTDNQ